jgi:Tol biopolymer transport system component
MTLRRGLVVVLLGFGLLGGAVAPAQATFPGVNGRVAFARGDLWTINPDGSQPTNITNEYVPSGPGGPGARSCGVAWSPNSPGPTDVGDAYAPELDVANADGSARRVVAGVLYSFETRPAFSSCFRPSWSPDGTQIAYTGGPRYIHSTSYRIYVVHADGTGVPVKISDDLGYDSSPAWSPSGRTIAFNSTNRAGSPDGIYTTSPTGGVPHYLGSGDEPNWAPDGTKLAVVRGSTAPGADSIADVWTINAGDGSPIRLLTQGGWPAWSPDGSKIAFHNGDRMGTTNIFSINADGSGGLTQLTSDGRSVEPDWQPLPCTATSSTSGGARVGVHCRVGG